MKLFTSPSQKIGEIGENETVKYLKKHNFKILTRNYTKRCGEIDVIAEKDSVIHFVEVKTIVFHAQQWVGEPNIRPEENLTSHKIQRLQLTIQLYLSEQGIDEDQNWVFDLFCLYLDKKNELSKIEIFNNLVPN